MALVGIIAEFNPLHSGHKLLIDTAKKDGNTVAVVISGNFVQRGDTAIIPKIKRASFVKNFDESIFVSSAKSISETIHPITLASIFTRPSKSSFGYFSVTPDINTSLLITILLKV